MSTHIGNSVSRVEGVAKVTGQARYAAEHHADALLYGVIVSSRIAKGRILSINSAEARSIPGVVDVVTHENRPALALPGEKYRDDVNSPGVPFAPLYDAEIKFSAQPVALVVAETFETARYAATLLEIEYQPSSHNTNFSKAESERFVPAKKREMVQDPARRGDARSAFAKSPFKITGKYRLATEHHNPMELFASTVIWEGDGRITIFDKTQGPQNVQRYISRVFGVPNEKVRILNPFVGGAFGSVLRPQYQIVLAVLAAIKFKRSIRVTMTRQQMFTHGHRPECAMSVSLATDEIGRLSALISSATNATSRFENYMENIVNWGAMTYACENLELEAAIVSIDTATPCDMRAPGAATGMNLFEIAMDEMAYAASIDPLQFRIINYSDTNGVNKKPYTSKALMAAYEEGAARFGWSKRSFPPRSMKDGHDLVGWGVATGIWEALMVEASARIAIDSNGSIEVASATSDIGTGTYTIMAQIASEALGVPIERVSVKLGNSSLPKAPVQGGSFTAASVGSAVHLACQALAKKLHRIAERVEGTPLVGASFDDVEFSDGVVRLKADPSRSVSLSAVVAASGRPTISAEETAKPGHDEAKKARNTHSAVFAEVKVDEELSVVRVTRIVCAVAAGRIINPKTARSQILGGVVMGLGMALHEESMMDYKLGRFINHNLAEYHVPSHADVQDIDVIFVDEPDPEVTPLGIKGVGEIGVVGTAAAIANAIFHATGKRIRELPITIDKILN